MAIRSGKSPAVRPKLSLPFTDASVLGVVGSVRAARENA
jgi:hypothetical protein